MKKHQLNKQLIIAALSVCCIVLLVSFKFSTKYFSKDEVVAIRVFSQLKTQSFTFSPNAGHYSLWANGVEIINTTKFPIIKLSYSNDSIEVKTFENTIGKFKRIKISSADPIKSFRLKLILPDRKPRLYDDNLIIEVEQGMYTIKRLVYANSNYQSISEKNLDSTKIPKTFVAINEQASYLLDMVFYSERTVGYNSTTTDPHHEYRTPS